MTRRFPGITFLAGFLGGWICVVSPLSPARGSEESQALGARALVAIDAGDTDDAMALLDRAAAADPTDAGVRYKRGTMRSAQGDYAGAIVDLRAALAEKPYFPQASLELGAALNEAGRAGEAVPRLQEARNDPALDAQASFLLGIAHMRLGQFAAADEELARALRLDPSLDLSVQYYRGVIAYQRHDFDTATANFASVQSKDPDSVMGREATRFLEIIGRAGKTAYQVFGTLALEYDSNVTLAPVANIPGAISAKGDGRFVMNAGAAYVPWKRGPFSLTASYQFFQSLHFDLTQYNLQNHRPAVQLLARHRSLTFGVLGRYDYYLLDTDSYMQEVTAFPWISIQEPGIDGRTDLYYRMQWRDFKKQSFRVLNGFYESAGARQFFDLGGHGGRLWFGYEFVFTKLDDHGDPVENFTTQTFEYDAQQADVGIRWPFPFEVTGEAGYRFEYQRYAAASGVYEPVGGRRKDYDHRVIVSIERPLTDYLTVVASYFGTFNDSNKDAFEYDRHIGSVGLQVDL